MAEDEGEFTLVLAVSVSSVSLFFGLVLFTHTSIEGGRAEVVADEDISPYFPFNINREGTSLRESIGLQLQRQLLRRALVRRLSLNSHLCGRRMVILIVSTPA